MNNVKMELLRDERFGGTDDLRGFIQFYAQQPPTVHFYSYSQLKLLTTFKGATWLHIDATSRMIKLDGETKTLLRNLEAIQKLEGRNMRTKPKTSKQYKSGRVFLYSVVGRCGDGQATFPVAEALLSRHHEPSITHFWEACCIQRNRFGIIG
jgi:hypothetical protein